MADEQEQQRGSSIEYARNAYSACSLLFVCCYCYELSAMHYEPHFTPHDGLLKENPGTDALIVCEAFISMLPAVFLPLRL